MPTVTFNTKYFLEWLSSYTDIEALKLEAKEAFKGINEQNMFKKAHKITAFLDKVVTLVERAAIDFSMIEGKDEPTGKKKLDIAADFLDKVIELPFYLEWFDGKAIRMFLSMTVQALNKHTGDAWKEGTDE